MYGQATNSLGWPNPLSRVKLCSVALANVYDADGSTIVIVCSDSSTDCTGASIVALQVWKK